MFSGDPHGLDDDICSLQSDTSESSSHGSDPDCAFCVQRLAQALLSRYTFSRQQEDLEQSILHFTEAIFQPLPWDTPPPFLNTVQIFYCLTLAICFRAEASRQPEDVRCCIMYLRYLREQWHEVPINGPHPIKGTLVRALGVKVILKLGDGDQDIDEMADLYDELLESDIAAMALIGPTVAFAKAVDAHYTRVFNGHIPPDKLINCLRKAIPRLPDLHDASIVLTECLLARFMMTPSEDDYNEGMALLDKIISFRDPGARMTPLRGFALSLIPCFVVAQTGVYGKPEYFEEAIYRMHNGLNETSLEDPDRPKIIDSLNRLNALRPVDSSVTTRVRWNWQEAQSSSSDSDKLPSFRDLIASLPDLHDEGATIHTGRHISPGTIQRLTDIAEIEDGIEYCQQLLASYPDIPLASTARLALGAFFTVHLNARMKSSTSTRQFQPVETVVTPELH